MRRRSPLAPTGRLSHNPDTLGQAVAIVVGVLLIGAVGLLVAERLRQRRRARAALDVFALIADALAIAPGDSVLGPEFPKSAPEAGSESDLWAVLTDHLDVSAFRPKLAEDVEIRIFKLRWGNDYAIAANPRDLLHLTLEVWEAELAGRMDGTRTVADLIVERLDEDGDLDAQAVIDLVQVFASSGFLEPRELDVQALLANAMEPAGVGRRLRKFAKTFTIEWNGVDAFVRALYRAGVRWFFNPVVAVSTSIVAVVGLALFVAVEREGNYTLNARAAPLDSVILIVLGWVLTFAHELGHASVLIHNGRRVKNAGFMLYFGSLALFVDSSDGLMLDARTRILQSFAGPFAESVLGRGEFDHPVLRAAGVAGRAALPFRAAELLRHLLEPGAAAGAGRVLDLVRPDPGARPPPSIHGVHATRPLAQDPQT